MTLAEEARAVLRVSDNGVGIAPEDLPHVFERFYRADKSRAGAKGHLGLGLAICKAIIDAHNGQIEVTSEIGLGPVSRFDSPRPLSDLVISLTLTPHGLTQLARDLRLNVQIDILLRVP